MPASRNFKTARDFSWRSVAVVVLVLALWSAAATWYFASRGYLQWYGDSEAHLNIARRITDSRTPGYDQIGVVWLPLPHLLMVPLAANDTLWRTGLAGSIAMGGCFVLAGAFLFVAVRRLFGSTAAGAAAVGLLAANPNLMYLQSAAMTEGVMCVTLMALLYFTVRFRQTQGWGAAVGAGVAGALAALARYDGWFLVPFTVAYFLIAARRRRLATAVLVGALASLGPLWWLAHNWWLSGDALDFYRGPYSAVTITGAGYYPGKGNWALAWLQYRSAVWLCAGSMLVWMGMAGGVVALVRRGWWALLLCSVPALFYLWSIHSAGVPLFVPLYWPHSYYNTRFGVTLIPLLALAASALVTALPRGLRPLLAVAVVALGAAQWVLYPRPESWITWRESLANSEGRRAWTREAADYLRKEYRPGTGIVTSFGDVAGIYRYAGIPFREIFTGDNGLPFEAMTQRPELWLHTEWAVVQRGDAVDRTLQRAAARGIPFRRVKSIAVKDQAVLDIYRR